MKTWSSYSTPREPTVSVACSCLCSESLVD